MCSSNVCVVVRRMYVSPRLSVNAAFKCQLIFICVSAARVLINFCMRLSNACVVIQRVCVSPRLPVNTACVCQLISVCVSAARVCQLTSVCARLTRV
jgi:hypothetical protein